MTGLPDTWRRRGGRRPGPPDYVGVGSLWSGVGWWHTELLKHPDVQWRRRSRRSLFFFQPFCERPMTEDDAAAYRSAFWRRPGRMAGEWSQRYMFDHWTPPLLRRVAPDARLLVMLSNPVDRYRRKLVIERKQREADEVAYFMSEILTRGRYASQLRHLWEYFERDQVLVLQFERCRADPVGQYARTLRFLGLRDDFEPFTRLRGRIGQTLRSVVSREPKLAELWPDLLDELRLELAAEMLELQELVPGLDLALWPDFADLATARKTPAASRV